MLENDHTNVMTKQIVAERFIRLLVRKKNIREIVAISKVTLAILSTKEMEYKGHSTAQVEIMV